MSADWFGGQVDLLIAWINEQPAYGATRTDVITVVGCWAHVRRKFHDALEQTPRTAGWLLRQIQHLYRVEAELRAHHAGPNLRTAMRSHHSRPIVERFKQALVRFKSGSRHLPQSLLGQAIDYALGQWPTLEIFLNDGRVKIDNDLVENAIRPTAISKKNWLFIGAAEAGERSAIIYTIIESCRRRGCRECAVWRQASSAAQWFRRPDARPSQSFRHDSNQCAQSPDSKYK